MNSTFLVMNQNRIKLLPFGGKRVLTQQII